MAQKVEGGRFQISFKQMATWDTATETTGTDSPATLLNFFISMPSPIQVPEGKHLAEAQTHRA